MDEGGFPNKELFLLPEGCIVASHRFLGTKLHIGTNPVKSAMHICDVSYDFLLFLLLFHKKKWVSFIFILLFLSHEIRGKYLHGAAVEHGAR